MMIFSKKKIRSPWSDCDTKCGRGKRKRYTMCGTIR